MPRGRRAKDQGGRPAHVPTDPLKNLAKICAALGKKQYVTAALMGISVDTLQRYYRAELELGKNNIDVAVAGKLISAATAKEHTGATVDAAKFWAKSQMGWTEKVDVSATVLTGQLKEADPLDIIESRLAGIRERSEDIEPPAQLQ